MSLVSSTRAFLATFYVLGLSPYNPQPYEPYYLSYGTVTLQAMLGVYLAIFSIIQLSIDRTIKLFGNTELLFISIFLFSAIFRSLFMFQECVQHRTDFGDILNAMQNLQSYFQTHLAHRISNARFARQYLSKFMVVIGVSVLYIIFYAVNCLIIGHVNAASLSIRVIQLITVFIYLRILFYMDTLGYHLGQLNVAISHNINKCGDYMLREPDEKCDMQLNLLHYKTIHFRLWVLSQKINDISGYSLMAILFETFMSALYSAYWLFEELHRNKSYGRIPGSIIRS